MTMIRPATADDVTWLLEQLRDFDKFFGGKRSLFPSDPAVARAVVAELVDQHPFFVAQREDTDVRLGFIAGALAPHPYNPELVVLSELFWWVDPLFRRSSSAGARLLDHFVRFGQANADWIQMTLEAQSPIDAGALERRGFVLKERTFLFEVERMAVVQ